MTATTTTVTASDGASLLVRTWSPDGDHRADVVLIHGLGEHSGRYLHVGERLADAGYRVRAADLRGHGRSAGTRAYVDRFDVYLDDVTVIVPEADERPHPPIVMLGHSMGGLIALAYALSDRPSPDLLVLSAPLLGADISAVKRAAARFLGGVAPRLALPNDITADHLSRNPAVGEAYFADPLVYTRTTTRLGREMLAAMDATRARLPTLSLPTLVIHGGDDALVPPRTSAPLATLPGVERVVFDGFRHESFNEEGGAVALDAVIGWIERNL
jgi:alpha-beta hydrolase superfamily lysophospholipase